MSQELIKIEFSKECGVNITDEQILAQVKANIRRQIPQVIPYQPNDEELVLVCGGPSLNETEKELIECVWRGAKVACVNNTYNWCIERNIKPSVMLMLDGRQFNSRFVKTSVPGCRYLLAAQCHPDTFDICEGRDVTIWHACSAGDTEVELLKEYYFEKFYPITLGTTAGIRAISVLRMLGFQAFHIFGLDSCCLGAGDIHHGYSQSENDGELMMNVWLVPKGREDLKRGPFRCSPWHVKQAHDFEQLVKERGNMFRLDVRGPGLIAAILETAAKYGLEDVKIVEK